MVNAEAIGANAIENNSAANNDLGRVVVDLFAIYLGIATLG